MTMDFEALKGASLSLSDSTPSQSCPFTMSHPPKEWLKYKTTPEEAEAVSAKLSSEIGREFSVSWLKRWSDLKDQLQDGDELWFFEHLPEPLTGAAGYCILRDGESVASIATMVA